MNKSPFEEFVESVGPQPSNMLTCSSLPSTGKPNALDELKASLEAFSTAYRKLYKRPAENVFELMLHLRHASSQGVDLSQLSIDLSQALKSDPKAVLQYLIKDVESVDLEMASVLCLLMYYCKESEEIVFDFFNDRAGYDSNLVNKTCEFIYQHREYGEICDNLDTILRDI